MQQRTAESDNKLQLRSKRAARCRARSTVAQQVTSCLVCVVLGRRRRLTARLQCEPAKLRPCLLPDRSAGEPLVLGNAAGATHAMQGCGRYALGLSRALGCAAQRRVPAGRLQSGEGEVLSHPANGDPC